MIEQVISVEDCALIRALVNSEGLSQRAVANKLGIRSPAHQGRNIHILF